MDPRKLPIKQRVQMLVEALDGASKTNEALSSCKDGEAMIEVLLEASTRLDLGISRNDLLSTPPIRDWIWWKNKEALLTLGSGTPRHQQDSVSDRKRFLGGLF